MTKNELKDFLKQLYEDQYARRMIIESIQMYLDKWSSYGEYPGMKEHNAYFLACIDHERDEIKKTTATVEAWSQYIKNETYRDIFIDRYTNGMKWEDIADKYNYSTSQIFHINSKCCGDIARKTVTDIMTDRACEAVSI